MSAAQLIVACVALPVAGALGMALAAGRPRLRAAAALASAVLLAAGVLGLLPRVWAGAVPQLFVLELLPGAALGFRVEPMGMLLALAAAGLWLADALRGAGPRSALQVAAAMGFAYSANVTTLVACGALLTMLARPRAAPLGVAAALLLIAGGGTWALAGTLEFLPGGILSEKGAGAVPGALLAAYLVGFGAWALALPQRGRAAVLGVFAALKVIVYVFGVRL